MITVKTDEVTIKESHNEYSRIEKVILLWDDDHPDEVTIQTQRGEFYFKRHHIKFKAISQQMKLHLLPHKLCGLSISMFFDDGIDFFKIIVRRDAKIFKLIGKLYDRTPVELNSMTQWGFPEVLYHLIPHLAPPACNSHNRDTGSNRHRNNLCSRLAGEQNYIETLQIQGRYETFQD